MVIDLLFTLHRQVGTTLMLVTHDLDVAHRTQRIIRLKGGMIVEDSGPEPLRNAGNRDMGVWENGQRAADTWQMRQMVWLWKMAWRDSRGSRQRLLLAVAAISIGMAAFIAITAFDSNVRDAVRTGPSPCWVLIWSSSSQQPLTPETEALLAELGGEQSREISCTSMAYFPKSAASRLVQVRALEGVSPTMGLWRPNQHWRPIPSSIGLQAVVDDGLLLLIDAQVGDAIKIGRSPWPVPDPTPKGPG